MFAPCSEFFLIYFLLKVNCPIIYYPTLVERLSPQAKYFIRNHKNSQKLLSNNVVFKE